MSHRLPGPRADLRALAFQHGGIRIPPRRNRRRAREIRIVFEIAHISPSATISTMDPLLAWRDEFPILAPTTYMISHSLGAMPKRAAACVTEFTETWATRGIRAWEEGWWEMPVTTGNLIGRLIGAA